jgi:ankyrin repeat protein
MIRAVLLAAASALALSCAAGASDLLEAARDRDHAAAMAAIEAGADVRAESPDGTTALHWAVYAGDRELAQRLLEAGADVHATNYYGATPLAEAAIQADTEMLRILLDAGAEVDERNSDGQTPLMVVARSSNVEAAQLLIDRGADVNAVEQWKGQTALMWAAAQRQPEMTALLIANGADPNVRSNLNNHERHITAEPRYLWRPPGGLTPLIYAARQGCVGCARALVEGGADIDMADPEGATALLTASMNFNFDTAAYLIEAGANVNKWDWRGRNPLYAAIDLNTLPHGGRPDQPSTDATPALDVARMLLERGANPNMQLKLNPGYRHTKDDRGSDQMLHTIGATPLLRAAKAFDTPAIELLLEHGALVDLPNDRGMLPILAAAGMTSRVADTRGYFDTPDVQQRSIAALQALIDGGADVNAADPSGQTAVFSAAQWGWSDVVAFLVEKGARLDVTDAAGRTPYDAAMGVRGGPGAAPGPVHEDTARLIEELAASQAAANAAAAEEDPA